LGVYFQEVAGMAIFTQGMSEPQYKQALAEGLFSTYKFAPEYGKSRIDFVLSYEQEINLDTIEQAIGERHLLWAEVKNEPCREYNMLTQLLFTIHKTYSGGDVAPPSFLAVADTIAITFYNMGDFTALLQRNDIDWRATPSDYKSEKFAHLLGLLPKYVQAKHEFRFDNAKEMRDIKKWIPQHIGAKDGLVAIEITVGNLNKDIMERKGAYFTPRIWVEKAHEYLADALGDTWQDEYIVYDCAAGSGNLLAGLHNKRNIYASTIDEADVRIMTSETRPTFESHIFQFDFLNDDYVRQSEGGKVPDGLMDVLECPEKRKKLVVLINPPYAEGDAMRIASSGGVGTGRGGVAESNIHKRFSAALGKARGELFAQFLARVYGEFSGCILAEFSKLKVLQAANFAQMREWFKPKLLSCFVVPGNTFDNVRGLFPIGFKIWDTGQSDTLKDIAADVYTCNGYVGQKVILCKAVRYINAWKDTFVGGMFELAKMGFVGNDFQNQKFVFISAGRGHHEYTITPDNFLASAIYYAVRWSEDATWLNDRDQFLYPHTDPLTDTAFINDCLVFSIFHSNNHVSVTKGDNHWIPYAEFDVGVTASPFAYDTLHKILKGRNMPAALSPQARVVYEVGLEIFKYYHTKSGKSGYNVNAALYDIRRFFQGTKPNGHMNVKSTDTHYQALIEQLRSAVRTLRDKCISPKVYEYGFLPPHSIEHKEDC
jgi:hypothetical protein